MSPSRVLKLLSLASAVFLVAVVSGQQPGQSQGQQDRPKTGNADRDAAAASNPQGSSTLNEADRKFLQRATASSEMEIELSRMAVQKASNPDVKAYAQKMADDHTNALQQLQTLAQNKGVRMPDKGEGRTKSNSRLNALSGAEFDRAYMTQQVRHHQKDVAEFERQSNSNGDPEVRALASKMLPTLQEHLERARTVSAEVSSSAGTNTGGGNGATERTDTDERKK